MDATDEGDLTFGDHVFEDRALLADVFHLQEDIVDGDGFDEGGILGGAFAFDLLLGLDDGRLDALEQAGEVAELDFVDGSIHRAARVVTDDGDELGSDDFAGEFQAAEDVVIDDVARDPCVEDVPEALVKDQFGGGAGIEAVDNRCEWKLSAGRGSGLLAKVALDGDSLDKALVPLFEDVEGFGRGERLLLLTGEDGAGFGSLRGRNGCGGDENGGGQQEKEFHACHVKRVQLFGK